MTIALSLSLSLSLSPSLFLPLKETSCGGILLAPSGVISTPNFPAPYKRNQRCVWRISTDPDKRIALGVKDGAFDVEAGSSINACDMDYVTVYDGDSKSSNKIGPFCGNTTRPFHTIHSSGRHLYVEFQSNSQVQQSGFALQYRTYREGSFLGFLLRERGRGRIRRRRRRRRDGWFLHRQVSNL